jgi:hypothetical protein
MRVYYFLFLFLTGITAFSQEILTGLQHNPVIAEKAREYRMQKASAMDSTPISLPFYDDFSAGDIFPSSLRWADRYTYVNTDFPVYPIDYGAVTFDAINDSGNIYPEATPGPQTFRADQLTSRFIRLDSVFTPAPSAYTPADSVFLSFYYQPQGRGLAPTTSDSLILQFLLKEKFDTIIGTDTVHVPDIWKNIWASPGMSLDTFYIYNNVFFKRVMIPITDSANYFKKNFRFRFMNLVSLSSSGQPSWQSNCDEWNIDQVYLNSGRSQGDTVHKELRFVERAPSMLKKYTAMPYTQYSDDPLSEITDTLSILLTNRDILNHSANYSYYVTNPAGTFSGTYNSQAFAILPYYQYSFGYLMHPPVSLLFPIDSGDSASFTMKHVVRDLNAGSTDGDTIIGYQNFYNYYAYDDGTPEAGYGLKGAGARLAYQFKLNNSPDTLRAIRIYFNHTLGQNNQQYFYLTVWSDNNGKPGDTIYHRLAFPVYTDSLYKFYTYNLENPVRISGTFYIGTEQTTDDNLNIGFDLYNNSEQFIYYNATGTWYQSTLGGTLLMRPVIGKPIPTSTGPALEKKGALSFYPNPCYSRTLHLQLQTRNNLPASDAGWSVILHDMTGRIVTRVAYSETIDISGIPGGIYLLEARNNVSNQSLTGKLVVIR